MHSVELRLDCQSDLSASLTRLNKKSKLFVIREAPTTLLPKLFRAWKISHLVFEKDTDAYGRQRDGQVMDMASRRCGDYQMWEDPVRLGRLSQGEWWEADNEHHPSAACTFFMITRPMIAAI